MERTARNRAEPASRSPAQPVRERSAEALGRRALPWLLALALVASWWLSLIVLLDTPLIDLTPPKIVVLAGAAVLLAVRPWRGLNVRGALPMLVLAALLCWFPLAALLRMTVDDLKTTIAYVVFGGLAAALAYAAARFEPQRAARALVLVVFAVVVVSFFAAALEKATYPVPGQPDPLSELWSFFRPRAGLEDPRLGYIGPPPLHSPTGEPGVVRATAFFVQTNYLAFFVVLAVPFALVLFLSSIRQGRRRRALLAAAVLAAALVTAYWTYARVGILAVIAVALAALAVEWLSAGDLSATRRSLGRLRPTLLGLGLVVAVMAASFSSDGVGLGRLTGTTLGDAGAGETPDPSVEPIAESAARSAELRLKLQRTALEMVVDEPRSMLLGAGLAAYETAVHDPRSPRRIPEAVGIRDPNSLWLTVALAGGVVAVALLAVLLGSLLVRLARAVRLRHERYTRVAILGLAAWLPVWAVVQVFGTNPFNTSEAIIFGTMVGSIAGLTEPYARLAQRGRSGDVDQA